MLKKLQHWLRHSAHVHVRSGNVANMHDLVVMIDAFLDDKLAYDLQWDDFISWKHENPNIEAIRKRIAATAKRLTPPSSASESTRPNRVSSVSDKKRSQLLLRNRFTPHAGLSGRISR